jgi:VanZ family protein
MFSIMVLSWCWAIHKKPAFANRLKKVFAGIALACLAYGIVMEFIQHYFIPYRGFDYGDIVADAAGCGLGLVFSTGRYIKK